MAEVPVAIAIQPVVAVEKLLVVISFSPYLVDDNLFAKPPNGLRLVPALLGYLRVGGLVLYLGTV